MKPQETDENLPSGRAARLIDATLLAWGMHGAGEISARTIAGLADANVSSIYYHFDDLEHLYEAAQAHALDIAGAWRDAQRAAIFAIGPFDAMPAQALAPLLANLIDTLCEDRRDVALAWRECQLMAARNPRFAPLRDRWQALWQPLLDELCAAFGLGGLGDLAYYFFEGESLLHLMRWNRPVDRACLEEMASGWVAWMAGRLQQAAPWRSHVRENARSSVAGGIERDGVRRCIADAAARLLAAGGVGAVTHRAVAAEAELTLGVVSHHYKRTGDLLRAAFSEVYVQLTGASISRPEGDLSPPGPDTPWPAGHRTRAIDELVIAVARGRADADLARRLRYLRGNTSRLTIVERTGADGEAGVLAAAIYSTATMSALRTLGHLPEAEAMAAIDAITERMFGRLVREK